VPVYRYELPEDPSRLREAIAPLAEGRFRVVLFTTAFQIVNLMRVAEEQGRAAEVLAALGRTAIGSIGPTTTEALEEYGLRPALEPSHPRMGLLVRETAAVAAELG
jgi:uroporphyrinogen-III synthase